MSYHYHAYGSPRWALRKPDVIVGGVVGLCCLVSGANWYAERISDKRHDQRLLNFMRNNFACSLHNVRQGRWWVMLTCSVMHSGPMNLALNMCTLWGLGQQITMILGAPSFLGVWIFAGLGGSAAHLGWQLHQIKQRKKNQNPKRLDARTNWDINRLERYRAAIGASGSLTGLLGALMCYDPMSPVMFYTVFPMRVWGVNLVLALVDVVCTAKGYSSWLGHGGLLGGLASGMIYYYAKCQKVSTSPAWGMMRGIGRILPTPTGLRHFCLRRPGVSLFQPLTSTISLATTSQKIAA